MYKQTCRAKPPRPPNLRTVGFFLLHSALAHPTPTTLDPPLTTPMRPTSLRSSLFSLSRPGTGLGAGTGTGTGTGTGLFYCPSCATCRRRARRSPNASASVSSGILARQREPPAPSIPGYGQFTTSTSTSTATSTVPPRFRELHAALNRVGETATDRLDLSRLQLALRGLEVEEPLIRVASTFFLLGCCCCCCCCCRGLGLMTQYSG